MGGAAGGAGIAKEQDFLALDIDGDRGESGRGVGGEGYQQMQLVEQQVCLLSLYLARSYVLGLGYLHRVDRVENHCEA